MSLLSRIFAVSLQYLLILYAAEAKDVLTQLKIKVLSVWIMTCSGICYRKVLRILLRRTFLFSSTELFYPYLSIFFTALLPLPVHFLLLHPLCSAQTLLLFLFFCFRLFCISGVFDIFCVFGAFFAVFLLSLITGNFLFGKLRAFPEISSETTGFSSLIGSALTTGISVFTIISGSSIAIVDAFSMTCLPFLSSTTSRSSYPSALITTTFSFSVNPALSKSFRLSWPKNMYYLYNILFRMLLRLP